MSFCSIGIILFKVEKIILRLLRFLVTTFCRLATGEFVQSPLGACFKKVNFGPRNDNKMQKKHNEKEKEREREKVRDRMLLT